MNFTGKTHTYTHIYVIPSQMAGQTKNSSEIQCFPQRQCPTAWHE